MNKRVAGLVLVLLAAGVIAAGFIWKFNGDRRFLRVPGVVEVHEVNLGSKLGGRVAEVFVREGDEVAAERHLIRFETPELEAQKAQIEQRLQAARAEWQKAKDGPRLQEVAEADAALAAAKARLDRIEEGWRKEEKQQAENDLSAAQADLDYARRNFKRFEDTKVGVSPTEYDIARTRLAMAQEKYNSTLARVDMLKAGSREQDKREARAEHDRAKARAALLHEGTRAEDMAVAAARMRELEAALRELEANLNEAVVRAPSAMVVEVLAVRKGDLVAPHQPVIRGLLAEERWVKIFVPSTDLGRIKLGDRVEVACDSFPDKTFPGTIIQIATVSEFTPRNVQSLDERRNQVFAVKVRVDDGGAVFKAGMAAEVLLPLQEAPR